MTDHDSTVIARRADIDAYFEACQTTRADLIREVESWYPGWVTQFAAERVKANHARVLKLAPGVLDNIRGQVDRLTKASAHVIQRHLGTEEPSLWPHYTPLGTSKSINFSGPGATISGAIRAAQGELGTILIQSRIEEDRWGSGNDTWSLDGRTNTVSASTSSVVNLPTAIHTAIGAYAKALDRYEDARGEYADAVTARDEARAAQLWGA